MTLNENRRHVFMQVAESHLNRWYIWGGDDPSGFDCSGLVIECLKSIGKLAEIQDFTANGLWNYFKEYACSFPKRGTIVFWFGSADDPEKATHVAICIDDVHCITADGGGSKTKTVADAKKHNAFIKIRPISKRKKPKRFIYIF